MQLLIDGAEVVDGDGNPIDLGLPEGDVTDDGAIQQDPGTDIPDASSERAPEAAAEEEPEA
jgi:hypothetical protein